MNGIEVLEGRGALVQTEGRGGSLEREGVIAWAVRERQLRARESRHFLAGSIAVFGATLLLAGFVPDHRRERTRRGSSSGEVSRDARANR